MSPDEEATAEVTLRYVHPRLLRFDPTNPRFASGGTAPSQPAIQALLEKEPHYALELIPSFLENGFIDYEPLVVRYKDGVYVVIEGNRRLAAIRHILGKRNDYAERSSQIGDLESIPVLVFPKKPAPQREKEQRVYLGVRHLFGFREWPPESKARYLDTQIKSEADLERLARELNIKRQDIQRYLVPYRLRKAAGPLWKKHRDQDFWVLGEGLNRSGIKSYIALEVDRGSLRVRSFDPDKLNNLLRFIYGSQRHERADRVVKETRQLSSLAKVLQHRKAAAALERGRSLAEASILLESETESLHRLNNVLRECGALLTRLQAEARASDLMRKFRAFKLAAQDFLKDGR
jgi:hypothetical protein